MNKGVLIGQGRTADVYAWGEDRVLKLYQDWMPVPAIEHEFKTTRAAYTAGLSVPAADELVEMDGRCGIVLERLQGRSMLKELQDKLWTFPEVARQLAELHFKMHKNVAPPGLRLQREQIESGIRMAASLPDATRDSARRRLAELPDGEVLCHGDFHPDNVILTSRGPVIIDWMTGTRGHPLADVARTRLLILLGGLPPGTPWLMGRVINVLRVLLHRSYLARYLELSRARRKQVEAWQLPLLAARIFEVEVYPQERDQILAAIQPLLAADR
jgi:uncharacterized protein (TIGR02172 family)